MSDLGNGRSGDGEAKSGTRPVYSIGAVVKMLGVDAATLRAWEERYALVIPARTKGGQRVYSRDDLDHLRFVANAVADGSSTADAHRLLGEELESADDLHHRDMGATTIVILLAERDRYAADLAEYLLRTEGYDVCLASDPTRAGQLFAERTPDLSVIELMITDGGLELCRRLTKGSDSPVLAISALDLADDAIASGASAFLLKPIEPLQFISTVRDLLGSSALTRPSAVNA
jgi:DNA-binding transcriptional MerR regulator